MIFEIVVPGEFGFVRYVSAPTYEQAERQAFTRSSSDNPAQIADACGATITPILDLEAKRAELKASGLSKLEWEFTVAYGQEERLQAHLKRQRERQPSAALERLRAWLDDLGPGYLQQKWMEVRAGEGSVADVVLRDALHAKVVRRAEMMFAENREGLEFYLCENLPLTPNGSSVRRRPDSDGATRDL